MKELSLNHATSDTIKHKFNSSERQRASYQCWTHNQVLLNLFVHFIQSFIPVGWSHTGGHKRFVPFCKLLLFNFPVAQAQGSESLTSKDLFDLQDKIHPCKQELLLQKFIFKITLTLTFILCMCGSYGLYGSQQRHQSSGVPYFASLPWHLEMFLSSTSYLEFGKILGDRRDVKPTPQGS